MSHRIIVIMSSRLGELRLPVSIGTGGGDRGGMGDYDADSSGLRLKKMVVGGGCV